SAVFSLTATPPPELYTLSLHDALPIFEAAALAQLAAAERAVDVAPAVVGRRGKALQRLPDARADAAAERPAQRPRVLRDLAADRSEEHTSELQSLAYLVCRLLLEKKKK